MTELTMAALNPLRQKGKVRRHPATYADYLAWPNESAIVEWKDGEIIEYMPPTDRHQDVIGSGQGRRTSHALARHVVVGLL